MRIAFLDSWLQSVVDGSGTAAGIGGLQRALIARGQVVDRLAPAVPWPGNLTLRRLLFNLQLPGMLKARQYDLVVGFDIDGVFWSGRRGNTPYVVCIKGVIAEELQHERGRVRLLFQQMARLEARNARRADLVLATSGYCRRAIVRHYGVNPNKIGIVPEGIDLARWRSVNAERSERKGTTILCVARQYPRKHIADLVRAVPLVRATIPDARAVIVGDGPEHEHLRALAARLSLGDAIRFTGAVPDSELESLYRQAGVFCLPSVQEGFGIAFLEAMASGLPVVAVRTAAVPEVVPDGQAGLLAAPNQPAEIAAYLIRVLRSPAERERLESFGRQHVQQYDWDRVAGRFLDAIAPLVKNTGALAGHRPA